MKHIRETNYRKNLYVFNLLSIRCFFRLPRWWTNFGPGQVRPRAPEWQHKWRNSRHFDRYGQSKPPEISHLVINKSDTHEGTLTCASNRKEWLELCIQLTGFLTHFGILFVISYLERKERSLSRTFAAWLRDTTTSLYSKSTTCNYCVFFNAYM